MIDNHPLQSQLLRASGRENLPTVGKPPTDSANRGLAKRQFNERSDSENRISFENALSSSAQPDRANDQSTKPSDEFAAQQAGTETEIIEPAQIAADQGLQPTSSLENVEDIEVTVTSDAEAEVESLNGLEPANQPIAIDVSRGQALEQTKTEPAHTADERSPVGDESSPVLTTRGEPSSKNHPLFPDRHPGKNGWQTPIAETASLETVPSVMKEPSTPSQTYTVESSTELVSQTFARLSASIAPDVLVPSTGSIPSSFANAPGETGLLLGNARVVSTQVAETMFREVSNGNMQGSKTMTLYLHPAELGKLTVHVGWDSQTLTATIVTSELGTSELLNRDRGWLINNFEASGFDLTSFDVSYGGSDVEREFNQQFDHASQSPVRAPGKPTSRTETQASQITTIDATHGKGTVVNIVV